MADEKSKYGVTQKYDRKNYESQKANREFHDSQFGDKKTIITEDGTILHRSKNAANNKYGQKEASKHMAEADHIDPLKNIHERHKDNLLLNDDDIKEIGNRQGNYQELSKSENSSKQETSELQEGIKRKNIRRISKGAAVQTETDIRLTIRTVEKGGELLKTSTIKGTVSSFV